MKVGTQTQDNWNSYFENKKTSSSNNKNKYGLIIILLTLTIVALLNKDVIIRIIRDTLGSSYNGLYMKEMISETNDIMGRNTDYIDEFINSYNTYQLSTTTDNPSFIDEWSLFLTNSIIHLEKTDFHKSYNRYIESVINTLYTTKQFISYCQDPNLDYMSINTGLDKIAEQSQLVTDELVKAFDKNLIEYTIIDDGRIVFEYFIR